MNLALFDFDGTITTRETFPDFMRRATPPQRLAFGRVRLAPVVLGYRPGLVSGTTVRARVVDVALRGVSAAHVEGIGETFARDVLPGLLRPEATARIAWHKGRGDTVVVVSGGFDTYLAHWCREHDLALLCSSLEQIDGTLTGRYAGAQCVGAEKCARIRAHYDLSRYARIHAYGDTAEDRDMLALATDRTYRWQPLP